MDGLLDRKPTTTLFHYTSQYGLLGIVKNKSLWATNILYLNDATEFLYAISIAKDEIQKRSKELEGEDAALYKTLNNVLDGIEYLILPAFVWVKSSLPFKGRVRVGMG